jgi:hypothetical protein
MAMGKRKRDRQTAMWVPTTHLPKTADQILASIARFAERTDDARAVQLLSRTIGTGH